MVLLEGGVGDVVGGAVVMLADSLQKSLTSTSKKKWQESLGIATWKPLRRNPSFFSLEPAQPWHTGCHSLPRQVENSLAPAWRRLDSTMSACAVSHTFWLGQNLLQCPVKFNFTWISCQTADTCKRLQCLLKEQSRSLSLRRHSLFSGPHTVSHSFCSSKYPSLSFLHSTTQIQKPPRDHLSAGCNLPLKAQPTQDILGLFCLSTYLLPRLETRPGF